MKKCQFARMFIDFENLVMPKLMHINNNNSNKFKNLCAMRAKLETELNDKKNELMTKQKMIDEIFYKKMQLQDVKTNKSMNNDILYTQIYQLNALHYECIQEYKNMQKEFDAIHTEYERISSEYDQLENFVSKEKIIYSAFEYIQEIVKEHDINQDIHIFSGEKFQKCNSEVNMDILCKKFGYIHHFALGADDAADNQLVYELRNYIDKTSNSGLEVYILTSDRALIVHSTYKFINNDKIKFHLLVQEKSCSPYMTASIKHYNNLERNFVLNNIYIKMHTFGKEAKYSPIIYAKEEYPKRRSSFSIAWKPWVPGTEKNKQLQSAWC